MSLQNDESASLKTGVTDASNVTSMAGKTATWKGNVISVTDVAEKRKKPNPIMIKELHQVMNAPLLVTFVVTDFPNGGRFDL